MRSGRFVLRIGCLIGLVSSATLVGAPTAFGSSAPSFSVASVSRDCNAYPYRFIPSGFVDGANGMTVKLGIQASSGNDYQTASSFTPDSDHFALSAVETMTYNGNPDVVRTVYRT